MVVGAFGFVVDIGTFTVLRRVFGINENIAQTVSFTAAIISNFTWNRYWTYPDSRTKKLGKQLLLFACDQHHRLADPHADLQYYGPRIYPFFGVFWVPVGEFGSPGNPGRIPGVNDRYRRGAVLEFFH